MTIEQYLAGKVDFNLNENAIASILFDRGVRSGSLICTVPEKQRDLCLADLYMYLASSSTATTSEYDSDGGWTRQRPTKVVFNRDEYIERASRLYGKWGESVPFSGVTIKLTSLY